MNANLTERGHSSFCHKLGDTIYNLAFDIRLKNVH